jgi:glycosyltransferase involved in cell wall biosynthesis
LAQLSKQGHIYVLPNAIDIESYSENSETKSNTLVFSGALDYEPNIEAVEWLAREIWPKIHATLPDFEMQVVGYNPPLWLIELCNKYEVSVFPNVPDVIPYICKAKLALVPLKSGAGTRLKILEAFACGTPVVSTRFGASGIDAQENRHISFAETPDEFLQCVQYLLDNPEEYCSRVASARELVARNYSWDTVKREMAKVMECVS